MRSLNAHLVQDQRLSQSTLEALKSRCMYLKGCVLCIRPFTHLQFIELSSRMNMLCMRKRQQLLNRTVYYSFHSRSALLYEPVRRMSFYRENKGNKCFP